MGIWGLCLLVLFHSQGKAQEFVHTLVDHALQVAIESKSESILNAELDKLIQNYPSLMNEIIEYVDGEHWVQTHTHRFSVFRSLFRSQGLTTDGKNFWYSSRSTLIRTNEVWGVAQFTALFPLPNFLKHLGDNHIGDIDYASGHLYIPIEDGSRYKNPYIGVYNSQTLTNEKYFRLPQTQQRDGVPWVAVDGEARRLYSSEYSNATAINAYDIDTLKPIEQIRMSKMVNSIQGAKVLNGMLYMTADGVAPNTFSLFKLNIKTGTLMAVGDFGRDLVEVEGLVFLNRSTDVEINALGVVRLSQTFKFLRRTELCKFQRDRISLRDQFRNQLLQ